MYKRILLAIDTTPTDENRSALKRAEQMGLLTGGTLYVLHVARSHIVSGDITGGAGLGVRSADDDVEVADRNADVSQVRRIVRSAQSVARSEDLRPWLQAPSVARQRRKGTDRESDATKLTRVPGEGIEPSRSRRSRRV